MNTTLFNHKLKLKSLPIVRSWTGWKRLSV